MSILHVTMKLVKTPTKQPYRIVISLVNSLFKISAKSLKLVLDAEQSGASSNLIVPTRNVQKMSFFFLLLLRILVKTFHGFHRNAIEYFSAYILP